MRRLDEVAFLQYTSGSTGNPKGVLVLHSNLLANLRAIAEGSSMCLQDVSYSWLPLFHDMGLIAGLLLGLYAGIPTYVARPKTFVTRPDTWLHAITRFGASISAGPNFAFGVLARIAHRRAPQGVDLSSWRLAFDGSERIDPETVREFVRYYAPHGFRAESLRPAYGLAECTLAASFARPGRPVRFDRVARGRIIEDGIARPPDRTVPSDSVEYTSVGTAVPGHRLRILAVNSSQELPERHVGEIVIEGPSVSPGYFRDQTWVRTARRELRTGDLGYLADGELFIVDRLKDLIIVAGRKYAPADIEQVVGRVLGVRAGAVAAFSARRNASEELFIIAARDASVKVERDQVENRVHHAVYEHFGVTPADVFVVHANHIPRTSSGKLRRSECRRMLESGLLDAVGEGRQLERMNP
jgi:acyl-CoA synthetase (AMP-forming)/AMP-acid ligase II